MSWSIGWCMTIGFRWPVQLWRLGGKRNWGLMELELDDPTLETTWNDHSFIYFPYIFLKYQRLKSQVWVWTWAQLRWHTKIKQKPLWGKKWVQIWPWYRVQRVCLELDKEQEIGSSTIAMDGCSFYPNVLMLPSPLLLSKRWTKGRFGGTKHIPRNLPAGIFHILPLSIDVSPFFVIC